MGNLMKKVSDLFLLFQICTAFLAFLTNALPATIEQRLEAARWTYIGENQTGLTQIFDQDNSRLTKLRVLDPTVPTFTAAMVQNTDVFGTEWWWYIDADIDQISALLATGRRLISVDPYQTADGLKLAVVMVPNTGAQQRTWWWYVGVDATTLKKYVARNSARIVELRPYNSNGKLLFAVIMIANTGADQMRWEWYYGEDIGFINDRVQTGLRLLCFSPDPFGKFVAVLVQANMPWYWYADLSVSQLVPNLQAHNTRLIDIDAYYVNGNLELTTVEIDDSQGPQGGSEI